MTQLFDAFTFALSGKHPGIVLIDGHKTYRHWIEPADVVNLEASGIPDVGFADQEVEVDHRGVATATDINGQARSVRLLVMVPLSPHLQLEALIASRDGAND